MLPFNTKILYVLFLFFRFIQFHQLVWKLFRASFQQMFYPISKNTSTVKKISKKPPNGQNFWKNPSIFRKFKNYIPYFWILAIHPCINSVQPLAYSSSSHIGPKLPLDFWLWGNRYHVLRCIRFPWYLPVHKKFCSNCQWGIGTSERGGPNHYFTNPSPLELPLRSVIVTQTFVC